MRHAILRGDTFSRRRFIQTTASLAALVAIQPRGAFAGDTSLMRVRQIDDLTILDPAFRNTSSENNVMRSIYRSLIRYKAGDKWETELDAAEMMEQVDPTHIKFKVKQGITWSDGSGELTAEDVKYTYERHADPKTESPYANEWDALEKVELTDKYSGTIVLKQPFAPLWRSTLPWAAGYILNRGAVERAGGKITVDPGAMCGPYVLTELTPKDKAVIKRNPDFKEYVPAFEEIHFIPIQDDKAAELAFEAGELEYSWVSVGSVKRYRETPPEHSKLLERPSLAWIWIGMNRDNPALEDIRVRQAIQKAVDVDAILQGAYQGVVGRATGIIAPGLLGHRNIEMPKRDVEGAKKLLAEVGAGAPTKLTITVLNTQTYISAAQIAQANLAEIGIELTINQYDGATFWTLGDQSSGDSWKDLQLILNNYSSSPDPSQMTAWYTTEQVGVYNWERFRNEEYDKLDKAALAELDDGKREAMYVKMQDLLDESAQFIFLTHELFAILHRDDIEPAVMPDATPIYGRFAGSRRPAA